LKSLGRVKVHSFKQINIIVAIKKLIVNDIKKAKIQKVEISFKFFYIMWKKNLVGSPSFITFVSSVTVKCKKVYNFGDLKCQLSVS
jgi:hypothetical protein